MLILRYSLGLFLMAVLSSCEIILLPLAIPFMALSTVKYEKDLSKDPCQGILVGKQYRLNEDICIYRFPDSQTNRLDNTILRLRSCNIKDGTTTSVLDDPTTQYSFVKAGTVVTVSKVAMDCHLGSGGNGSLKIYGTFEYNNNKNSFADITYLFKAGYSNSVEDLVPISSITEIECCDES